MNVKKIRSVCFDFVLSAITEISPELNSKIRYRHRFKKTLDLDHPKTLVEKLLWLKHRKYANDPLVKQCADKYAVREYIKKAGYEDILVDLYGVYDSPSEIDFDKLPNQFVLKWNFGSGFNIICPDKSKLDRQKTVKQLEEWGKVKCYRHAAELQYKNVTKKIICEKFLPADNEYGVIPDYKVYCFNGKPEAILVINDRGKTVKTEFFDKDWKPLENHGENLAPREPTKKPLCFDQMMAAAAALSAPFPFVRCDFYVVSNKLYFGEMTFTPAGSMYIYETKVHGKDMGDMLDLNR